MDFENIKPFVVYTITAPEYQDIYGTCDKGISSVIQGSNILITGGEYGSALSTTGQQEHVYLAGALDEVSAECRRFAEKGVAALIEPDERVAILYYVSRLQMAARIEKARDAGFKVIETGDVISGYDSAYAVFTGTGQMLSTFSWLEEVMGHDPVFLVASHGPQSELEKSLLLSAFSKTNPTAVIRSFQKATEQSGTALEALGDFSLFTFLIGPDGNSLVVNRRMTEVSDIEAKFKVVADEVEITLFYSKGNRLREFEGWLEARPIPKHWIRINT